LQDEKGKPRDVFHPCHLKPYLPACDGTKTVGMLDSISDFWLVKSFLRNENFKILEIGEICMGNTIP
jgi:hypothetical protein